MIYSSEKTLSERINHFKEAALYGAEKALLEDEVEKTSSRNTNIKDKKISRGALIVFLVIALIVAGISYISASNESSAAFIETESNIISESSEVGSENVSLVENIMVHVLGAVVYPGVVSVPGNSRIIDVINRVGGSLPEADFTLVNLARKVSDGEQIYVPNIGEGVPPPSVDGSELGVSSNKVNINFAISSELEKLPGIGPKLAQRIIDWREKNGNFSTIFDLKKISGIGDKVFENLEDAIFV